MMTKREYISPKFERVNVKIYDDVLGASIEWYKEYIDPEPGDWDDPIIDPDDEIEW